MAAAKSSSLVESGYAPRSLRPPVGHPADLAWASRPASRVVAVEPPEQFLTAIPVALRDYLDPAIREILGVTDQPELQRVRPHPPAEPDSLHAALDPRGQPCNPSHPHHRPFRGRGWQRGQVYEDLFMNGSRRIGAPQRGHGSPSRP